jgi:predicted alpha/beta superfamily hydrolase
MPERPNGKPWPELGGGDKTLDFIEHEVKPFIAARYRVQPGRQSLFGHSFGGLMVLHAAFTRPGSFYAFVASSPSIWVNDRQVLKTARAYLKDRTAPLRLRMTVGSEEEMVPETLASGPNAAAVTRWVKGNRMVGNFRDLVATLQAARTPDDVIEHAVIAGANHHTAQFGAVGEAFQFIGK